MRDTYDVIVVGARVGGSVLAALLGDRGTVRYAADLRALED